MLRLLNLSLIVYSVQHKDVAFIEEINQFCCKCIAL